MDISFIKNPIFIAIFAGIIAYLYMYYDNLKKQEANPKAKIEPVGYTTPGIIALITLFIAYSIFGFNASPNNVANQSGSGLDIDNAAKAPRFTEGATDSFGSNTYRLVGRNNIKLPQTDVFIDLAHF